MGPDDWVVDFPTLGFLAADWVEAHCIVPDGFSLGQPFVMDGWQLWCAVNHYRVRKGQEFDPQRPAQATAFHYRRSQVVGPQKTGKGPWSAAIVTFEAVGPCLFAGWARGGEVFRCEDDGCGCGFEYVYESGEPMGMRRPTSLIQLLATSEDQVDNVYRPLQGMIRRGALSERMLVREGFIRLPEDGRIDPVTAAANSKLGNPINFAVMDESGLYTARNKLLKVSQTMRRGLAGMGGRSIETTNPWDPMESSQAQQTFESRSADIFRFYRKPPADLSYRNKRDRHKIHQFVYAGSPWVDLAAIEAEAAELLETDPTQAERFFGNRLVQGLGSYMQEPLWDASKAPERVVLPGERIALGFDGSRSGDWTALRAETHDGHRFTPRYGPDDRPTFWNPDEWGGRIPRDEVNVAVAEMFDRYDVARMYVDPRYWETQADAWAAEHGDDVVVMWPTNQVNRMFDALVRFLEDTTERLTTHDDDPTLRLHALAARKVAKPGDKYILGKPAETQKIDLLMADVLAHEAAADQRAEGWQKQDNRVIVFR
ncbi:phage terminase family protein [Cellulomonas sp. ACRRI]|uniref:phage terminase family protein n=1 Tax=Cellulomonas sp. ACRRI TaxID=2918188 RepID=UPI001EF290BF|nr:phage terminase family protein [Cellulomonas sp. ACRRI]MCG7285371.1 phage terminase family protein [Cellulomonas sp. ACRRI]